MCGIAGAVRLDGTPADAASVAEMTGLIRHRGPDAEGTWSGEGGSVVFGHRRLSVIDLACGSQPMMSESGRLSLVYNGEIYNYVELRAELEREGVLFRTRSDTEVLLHLLEREWNRAQDRLVGMFAFAAWDSSRRELLLVRDRIGEKPLYYALEDGELRFCSSFAALQRTRRSSVHLDARALNEFLALGYVPAPRTIDASISKLAAGTTLRFSTHGLDTRRYWDLGRSFDSFEGTYEEALGHVRGLLSNAVRIRLRSDVPVGVFLSGGIDSSLVAACAKATSGNLLSFAIGFEERGYDETRLAEQAAAHIGAEHRTFSARFDIIDTLPHLVHHFGEPFGDPSALPLWHLAREARRHVTVAVGGDGGDEGFGGYPWYGNAARAARLRRAFRTLARRAPHRLLDAAGTRSRALSRLQRGLRVLAADDAEGYTALRSFIDPQEATRLYQGELAGIHAGGELQAGLATLFRDYEGTHLRRMRAVDIQTYLADCLLPKVEVSTMAHGLEARSPLLDPDLIQFGLSLPDAFLVDRRGGKRILRDVLRDFYPEGFFDRPKQGFSVPLGAWFAGPLRQHAQRLGESDALAATGMLRLDGITRMLDDHVRGKRDHGHRLYHLVVLDEWLRWAT
jgi:asparagine synthase (glutamine-hydrolysing)